MDLNLVKDILLSHKSTLLDILRLNKPQVQSKSNIDEYKKVIESKFNELGLPVEVSTHVDKFGYWHIVPSNEFTEDLFNLLYSSPIDIKTLKHKSFGDDLKEVMKFYEDRIMTKQSGIELTDQLNQLLDLYGSSDKVIWKDNTLTNKND